MTKVMIQRADYDHCFQAVDQAFSMFPVIVRNKKILVKPNTLRAAASQAYITTHPAVVRAVVDKLEELGPAWIIVGDNLGVFSYRANEKTFKLTGLGEASKHYYQNIGAEAATVVFNPNILPRSVFPGQ